MSKKLGFVGLGMMGLPMVANLAGAEGFEVLAYDLNDAPFEELAKHPAWGKGLGRAATMEDLGACETVVMMLPNSDITNRVVEGAPGQPGLATVLGSGASVIDMGSSNPAETLRLGALLAKGGVHLVDAPVSGAVAKAKSATLAIMAGCSPERLEELRPILGRMGSELIATGGLGSAHSMKALNNYVYAAGLLAASEALCIAERLGLDLHVLTRILNSSSGRNVATETKIEQFILPRSYSGGFALALQAKDLRTAGTLQDMSGFDAPQLSGCIDLWSRAERTLPRGADNTEIHRFIEETQARPAE